MNVKELMNSVVELNKRIESVNKERTRVETQRDMLNKQLSSLLDKYKAETGVSLVGETLEETQKLVQLEFDTIYKRVSEEYEFKNKVVQLISEGRYEEANNALRAGVITDKPATQAHEEAVIESTEPTGVFSTNSIEVAPADTDANNSDADVEGFDQIDFGFANIKVPFIAEETAVEEEFPVVEDSSNDFDVEDFGFGEILNGSNFLA